MAQWLRALAALPKDLRVQFTVPTWWLTTVTRGWKVSAGDRHSDGSQIHTQASIFIKIKCKREELAMVGHTPLILALRRQRQAHLCVFKANLTYTVRSRPARAT